MTRRALDEPLLSWHECVVDSPDSPGGVIVALPHDTDRFDVGLAVGDTEWGRDGYPEPGGVTVREALARLLTLREQWEWEGDNSVDGRPEGDPPPDWFPDESTPAWIEDAHGEEVWIAEWSS